METHPYFHPLESRLTPDTMRWGVNPGPETNFRGSSCPVARIFTCVPPTSMTRTPMAMSRVPRLAGLRQVGALGADHRQELVPGLDERLRALVLELGPERIDVDTGLGEPGQHLLTVATVGRQDLTELAVLGEGFERGLRHGVDREGRGKSLDV